ncbi:MAG: metallophosphoesterase [Caldilineaceae bacterium]
MNRLRHWIPAGAALAATAAGAGAAALAYAYYVEPRRIRLERLTIRLPNARGRLPEEGVRILHLSDSHFRDQPEREEPKIAAIRQLTHGLEYDLLVHTGDLIHDDRGVETAFRLLCGLPEPRLGRFVVLGNHDYATYRMQEAFARMFRTWKAKESAAGTPAWALPLRLPWFINYVRHTPLDGKRTGRNNAPELARRLQQSGFTLLHNRVAHLVEPETGLDLYLAGVDDVTEGRPRLGHTLDSVPAHAPVVLLSHNPDIIASPQLARIGLVLAGHTHGGQIVLPLWGPAHTQSWELARSEVAGYFMRGRTHVYITRGIGEGIPFRFGAPPQIALITLLPGD